MLLLLVGCLGPEEVGVEPSFTPPPISLPPNPFSAGCLEVSPARLRFDAVRARCETKTLDVSITNRCAEPVRLSGESKNAFGFVSLPLRLAVGESGLARVRFVPQTAGPASERLSLTASSGPFHEAVALQVDGAASAPGTHAFEVRVSEPRPAHLLFLLDDDGVDRAALELVFPTPWTWVAVADLEGTLHSVDGAVAWYSEAPTFQAQWLRAIQPSTPARTHSCHEAAQRLQQERRPEGFWEDPRLRIVCITDELDQSNASASEMIAAWRSRDFRAQQRWVIVDGVGCGTSEPRYEPLLRAIGGTRVQLCERLWPNELFPVSDFGWPVRVPLPASPRALPQTFEVRVEGQRLPDFTWWIDRATNDLVFNFLYAPEPSRRVEVRFQSCDVP